MTLFLIFFLLTLTGIRIALSHHRKDLSDMTYMMVTMALSMSAGFCLGAITGILLHGQLFFSTVAASAAAALAGLLLGRPFSTLAAVEGFFSGLMAAMMMVMLIDMLPVQDAFRLLFLSCMLFIFVVSAVLLHVSSLRKHSSFIFWAGMLWSMTAFVLLFPGSTIHPGQEDPGNYKHNHQDVLLFEEAEAGK